MYTAKAIAVAAPKLSQSVRLKNDSLWHSFSPPLKQSFIDTLRQNRHRAWKICIPPFLQLRLQCGGAGPPVQKLFPYPIQSKSTVVVASYCHEPLPHSTYPLNGFTSGAKPSNTKLSSHHNFTLPSFRAYK